MKAMYAVMWSYRTDRYLCLFGRCENSRHQNVKQAAGYMLEISNIEHMTLNGSTNSMGAGKTWNQMTF